MQSSPFTRSWGGHRPRQLFLTGCVLGGCLLATACGSNGGDAPTGAADGSDEASDSTPGNLPNLSTNSGDLPGEPEPEEPADCAVQELTACVDAALDELSGCLAASHGGAFSEARSSCALSEGDATLSFAEPVPRWNTAFLLSFSIDVAGQSCASYAESAESGSIPSRIELVTSGHRVTLETAADNQSTLTCDGVSARFEQSKLSGCKESKTFPSPELMDRTLSGVYEVSPRSRSNQRVFSCSFADSAP